MKANTRKLQVLAAVLSLCAFNAFAQATSDEKPAPSIYDQYPDCMRRGQVAAGDPAPCELPAPPSGRRALAPLGSNVPSSSEATGMQSITASAGNNSVSTTSSATAQPSAASRLRATH